MIGESYRLIGQRVSSAGQSAIRKQIQSNLFLAHEKLANQQSEFKCSENLLLVQDIIIMFGFTR